MSPAGLAYVRCLVVVSFLTASGVAAQEVTLDYDHAADFTKYKTFGWSLAQEPAKNPANHVRITRAVESNLATRGVTKATDGAPDLTLTYAGKVGEKVKVTSKSAGSYWEPTTLRTTVDVGKVKAGTLRRSARRVCSLTDSRCPSMTRCPSTRRPWPRSTGQECRQCSRPRPLRTNRLDRSSRHRGGQRRAGPWGCGLNARRDGWST